MAAMAIRTNAMCEEAFEAGEKQKSNQHTANKTQPCVDPKNLRPKSCFQ